MHDGNDLQNTKHQEHQRRISEPSSTEYGIIFERRSNGCHRQTAVVKVLVAVSEI